MRVGHGVDVHRFDGAGPLTLGGVIVDEERSVAATSDGDVAVHAIIDALLGAAALGDLGTHFPSTDPRWEEARSLDLLATTAALVRDAGHEVGNIDVTIWNCAFEKCFPMSAMSSEVWKSRWTWRVAASGAA